MFLQCIDFEFFGCSVPLIVGTLISSIVLPNILWFFASFMLPCYPCSDMHISMQTTWKWSSSHNRHASETTSTYVSAYTTIFLDTKSTMASSALSLVSISNQWNNGPMNSCPFGAMYWHAQEGGLLHVQALGFGQQRSQPFASKHWQITIGEGPGCHVLRKFTHGFSLLTCMNWRTLHSSNCSMSINCGRPRM